MSTRLTDRLHGEFSEECLVAVEECRVLGYVPQRWIGMVAEMGAVDAARTLILSGNVSDGFVRLVHMGRPDLTIEFAVLHPRWDRIPEFDSDVRQAAWWMLQQAFRGER